MCAADRPTPHLPPAVNAAREGGARPHSPLLPPRVAAAAVPRRGCTSTSTRGVGSDRAGSARRATQPPPPSVRGRSPARMGWPAGRQLGKPRALAAPTRRGSARAAATVCRPSPRQHARAPTAGRSLLSPPPRRRRAAGVVTGSACRRLRLTPLRTHPTPPLPTCGGDHRAAASTRAGPVGGVTAEAERTHHEMTSVPHHPPPRPRWPPPPPTSSRVRTSPRFVRARLSPRRAADDADAAPSPLPAPIPRFPPRALPPLVDGQCRVHRSLRLAGRGAPLLHRPLP